MKTLFYKLFYTNIKFKFGYVLPLIIVWANNVVSGLRLGYPPTLEQLQIFGGNLWFIRILSILFVGLFLYMLFIRIGSIYNTKIAYVSVILLSISPLISTLWINQPLTCVILALVGVIIHISRGVGKVLVFVSLGILLMNLWHYGNASPIYKIFDFKEISMEVNKRVLQEDSLTYRNELPLIVRRIGYNKITFEAKIILGQMISFFDLDSWFFGEISPNNNKSIVIFFWPCAIMFFVGIYEVVRLKDKQKNFLGGLFLIALMYFISKEGFVSEKMIFVTIPLSIICAHSIGQKNRYWNLLILVLVGYGYASNWNDMKMRTGFWFENRPMAMSILFKNIPNNNGKIFMTNLVSGGKEYCHYYLKNDCNKNIYFEGFDLSKGVSESGIYAGFLGEFVGKDFNNNFGSDWEKKITDKGINILHEEKIENMIANQYGDYLIVAEYEK